MTRRKCKWEDYKGSLKVTQVKSKINQLERKKADIDTFRKDI